MKSTILFKLTGVMFLTLLITYLPAQVKIGDNPSVQDASAILELEKTNMGLLITRVSLITVWDVTTIPSPANSLLVYNTNYGGGDEPVSPGFYYFRADQAKWIRLMTGSGGTGGDVWIDPNSNILSLNSAEQSLLGSSNVALGNGAFGDQGGPSNYNVAIGYGVCNSETTMGDACVVALGMNTAYFNSGRYLNALGLEAAMNNFGEYVTAIGHSSAYNNAGTNVNAIGPYAAHENSGNDVNAFGADAAFNNNEYGINALGNAAASNNSGFEINALGPNSCAFNSGDVVNAMGWQSAEHNGGNDLNAFGVRAAQNNHDTANSVNAIGLEAAQNNTGWGVNAMNEGAGRNNEGSLVNLLGPAAGENNDGWSVNALGSQSGQFNTGSELNAMGAMSAQYNTTAAVNAFGRMAARYNTGYGTNALGDEAAKFNNGEHNIAIGNQAMLGDTNETEGGGNIGIGYQAAMNVGTGQRNICIGHETDISNPSADDQINIGNNIIRDADGVIQLKNVIQLPPTTAPANPVAGMIYFDGAMLYCYDGDFWRALWEP